MKKVIRQLIVALCLTVAPTTVSAQELVIRTTNNEHIFHIDDAFHIYPNGDRWLILDRIARPTLVKVSEIKGISVRGSSGMKGDVNEDKTVDVADIANVIDIMAGHGGADQKAYTTCPNENHPHWIDLGLPSGTQCRCCNQGASKPEDYGGYYTFAEAQANNPPSLDQIKELLNNTTSVWTTQNGVYGRKFTGSNGGSLFLPGAGGVSDGELLLEGAWGTFWSSTPGGEDNGCALSFGSGGANWYSYSRGSGQSVRPVR